MATGRASLRPREIRRNDLTKITTMKTKLTLVIATGIFLIPHRSQAGGSSSADYAITADTVNSAGTTLGSADYNCVASVGGIGGISGDATSGYTVKNGFPGQLYNVVAAAPTAPATTVNEGATLQLGVSQVMDDSTTLPLAAADATWSVASGPISGIDGNGLATAASVYQDTAATVRATWRSFTGTLDLTVININSDDYGLYANDGLPDEWQVRYFGLNNPLAAPTKDADGTGQTNLFKYVAGLNPTDNTSVFHTSVQPVAGQPNQKQIVFSPVLAGRTYTVVYNNTLTDPTWTPLAGATQSDSGQQRTVTDTVATGNTRFYKVRITLP